MENLTNINVIKDIFERHGFTFSKALGQNFIINPSICPKIAEMGNAKKGFGIIEIGTGVGVSHKRACQACGQGCSRRDRHPPYPHFTGNFGGI